MWGGGEGYTWFFNLTISTALIERSHGSVEVIHREGVSSTVWGQGPGTRSNHGRDDSYTVLREGQGITLIISEGKAVSCLKTSRRALLHVCVL